MSRKRKVNIAKRNADVKKILLSIEKFKKRYSCKDPFHNNAWRDDLQKEILMGLYNLSYNDIIVAPCGQHKQDCTIPKLNIKFGEFKAQWYDNKKLTRKGVGEFLFDKQNDAIRRNDIYKYDFLMYSAFRRNGEALFSIILSGIDNVKLIHPIIRKSQEDKMRQIKECDVLNKRLPRDDIGISIIEVLNLLNDSNVIILYKGNKINKEDFLNEAI